MPGFLSATTTINIAISSHLISSQSTTANVQRPIAVHAFITPHPTWAALVAVTSDELDTQRGSAESLKHARRSKERLRILFQIRIRDPIEPYADCLDRFDVRRDIKEFPS